MGPDREGALSTTLTQMVEAASFGQQAALQAWRVTQSSRAGPNEHFLHRTRVSGRYYVEVKLAPQGAGSCRLNSPILTVQSS
jgi:hypothetical protein